MRRHLKILSGLFYVYAMLSALFFVVVAVLFTIQAFQRRSGGVRAEDWSLLAVFFLLYSAMTVVNYRAGWHVRRGLRRKECVVAAVLNLLPALSACYWTGLPLGIYGLIILLQSDTRAVFERVAVGMPLDEAIADRQQEQRTQRAEDAAEMDIASGWDEAGKGRVPPPLEKKKREEEW